MKIHVVLPRYQIWRRLLPQWDFYVMIHIVPMLQLDDWYLLELLNHIDLFGVIHLQIVQWVGIFLRIHLVRKFHVDCRDNHVVRRLCWMIGRYRYGVLPPFLVFWHMPSLLPWSLPCWMKKIYQIRLPCL